MSTNEDAAARFDRSEHTLTPSAIDEGLYREGATQPIESGFGTDHAVSEIAHPYVPKPRPLVDTNIGSVSVDEFFECNVCTLSRTVITEAATQMVQSLSESLIAWEEDTKARSNRRHGEKLLGFRRAVEAFTGDLLAGASEFNGWVSLSTTATEFTGHPVSRRHLESARDALVGLGMLEFVKGRQWVTKDEFNPESGTPDVGKGYTSRFRLTPPGLRFIEGFGLTPHNANDHFRLGLPPKPLRLRTASYYVDGKKRSPETMGFKPTPQTKQLRDDVHSLNEFLYRFRIEGQPHWGFCRIFSEGNQENYGWNKGGRLYSIGLGKPTYQQVGQTERLKMTIDGDPVAEVDVSSSHLTLLHGLAKVLLDLSGSGDLYTFQGLSRSAVKAWTTATLGKGKLIEKWSEKMIEGYKDRYDKDPKGDDEGNLRVHDPKAILKAMVESFPLLGQIEALGVTWADLQYHESCAVLDTMLELKDRSIPSLPVHDSLIVRTQDVEVTQEVLKLKYLKHCHIEPRLKVTKP